MLRLRASILLLASLMGVSAHAAPACHATSGPLTLPLVELYTSEGCDSCPPAERWLASALAGTRAASAVALAFHVDYWDRLGWVDRFGDPAYTRRQYEAMRANGASFVYTPQVLVQGRDVPQWRDGAGAAIAAASRAPARATLTLDVLSVGRDVVVVRGASRLADAHATSDARLYVAYADSGLVSDVKAGENRGARLVHDHVVRVLRRVDAAFADGRIEATVTLPVPAEKGTRPAIVAFVQREGNGEVLQSLELPLGGCDATRTASSAAQRAADSTR